jgi:carbamate kinase
MKYNLFNIDRQRNNFESMKAVVDKDLMNDVYARDGDTDTFWFVGKVARVSGA